MSRTLGRGFRWGRCFFFICLAAAWGVVAAGCAKGTSSVRMVEYPTDSAARTFRESFDEAYYGFDSAGNVELVLRRREPGVGGGEGVTQVLHASGVWSSIPGKTIAESTQINAAIRYFILEGDSGTALEGAGSLIFSKSDWGDRIIGTIDHSALKPTRRLAASGESPFERVTVSANFRAVNDYRRAVRIVHELEARFGPAPPFQPPSAKH